MVGGTGLTGGVGGTEGWGGGRVGGPWVTARFVFYFGDSYFRAPIITYYVVK